MGVTLYLSISHPFYSLICQLSQYSLHSNVICEIIKVYVVVKL